MRVANGPAARGASSGSLLGVRQADSAVGGKTGVDSSISKNAFGAFWYPAGVYIDVATLATLEDRQFRAGLVESVKHAIIADADYFDFLEANLDAILMAEDRSRFAVAMHEIGLSTPRSTTVCSTDEAAEAQQRL